MTYSTPPANRRLGSVGESSVVAGMLTALCVVVAGLLLVKPRRANAQTAQNDPPKRPSGVTEESRLYQRADGPVDPDRYLYEELNRWHAPPTLAGPLFTIDTVYKMADAAPIVTTDLGPGVRIGAFAPVTRQAALLQSVILGPNYAAISVGIP